MAPDIMLAGYQSKVWIRFITALLAVTATWPESTDRRHIDKIRRHTQDRDKLPAMRFIQPGNGFK
jgi:hypothetical protein